TPGVVTPSDIERALDFGLEVLKFFPAETLGGLKALKAISAPYGMCSFIPTGGINAKNVADYLQFAKVLACGGTWIATKELIQAKKFDELWGQGKERRRGRVAEEFGRLECAAAVALAAGVPAVIIRGGRRGKFRRCRLGRVAHGWGWMAAGVAGSGGRVARCGAGLRQRAAALRRRIRDPGDNDPGDEDHRDQPAEFLG
ncbi:MAG: hypothetical protein R6X05_02920, partial [Desulfobacterales bacterium]